MKCSKTSYSCILYFLVEVFTVLSVLLPSLVCIFMTITVNSLSEDCLAVAFVSFSEVFVLLFYLGYSSGFLLFLYLFLGIRQFSYIFWYQRNGLIYVGGVLWDPEV